MDYPPNNLTIKESLLYVLKYASLLGDIPLHLREIHPIVKIFQTLDTADWDVQTWIDYSKECTYNSRLICDPEDLLNTVKRVMEVWPLEMNTEPEGFSNLTITSNQIAHLINDCQRHVSDFATMVLQEDRDILISPDSVGFRRARFRRKMCFRAKANVAMSVYKLDRSLHLAKQFRRDIHAKIDPETIYFDIRHSFYSYMEPELGLLLRTYLGLPPPTAREL